jgi:hypothetical protein
MTRKLFVFLIMLSASFYCQGSESYLASEGSPNFKLENNRLLLAQATDDDAFDPFSDYSEFDEATDEEADINFFKNGRFLTVGFQLGFKGFTDNLANDYTSGGTYGLYMSYFFDLRFALQFGYSTGDYSFSFNNTSGNVETGNVAFSLMQIDTKYYFNTQNVTKGLADLNPYLLAGLSNVYRTYTLTSLTGVAANATSSAWGLDLGAGIEIPMLKKKAYFGFQATFHYVTFPDSNSAFYMPDYTSNSSSTLTQSGYQYDIVGLVGINF